MQPRALDGKGALKMNNLSILWTDGKNSGNFVLIYRQKNAKGTH